MGSFVIAAGGRVASEGGVGMGGVLDLGFATLSEKDIQLSADSYDDKTLSTARRAFGSAFEPTLAAAILTNASLCPPRLSPSLGLRPRPREMGLGESNRCSRPGRFAADVARRRCAGDGGGVDAAEATVGDATVRGFAGGDAGAWRHGVRDRKSG